MLKFQPIEKSTKIKFEEKCHFIGELFSFFCSPYSRMSRYQKHPPYNESFIWFQPSAAPLRPTLFPIDHHFLFCKQRSCRLASSLSCPLHCNCSPEYKQSVACPFAASSSIVVRRCNGMLCGLCSSFQNGRRRVS